jgi:MFS transporter, DHA1 family, multidrug resistance protein
VPVIAAPTVSPMSQRFLIGFCGLLLAMNAISCDSLLPALFAISADLRVPIDQAQTIIPIFLLAAGAGQLVFGALSDAFGRRRVIISGMVLYLAGTLTCLLAPSIGVLQAGRFLQGFAAACGVVVARAVLRDTHSGADLGRALAFATAIFSLGPIVAPLIGTGIISVAGHWRAAFLGMTIFSGGLMAAAIWRLRETNLAPDRSSLEPRRLIQGCASIIGHPQSRYFLCIAAVMSFAIISTVANASRVYASAFGIEGVWFAAAFSTTALGIIAAQFLNARLIRRLGILRSTRIAAGVMLAVVVVMSSAANAGLLSALTFTGLLFLFNATFLTMTTNCITMIVDPHKSVAGLASSLYGFLTQATGSILTLLTAPLIGGDIGRWTIGQLCVGVAVFVAVMAYQPATFERAAPAPHNL